MFGICRYTGIVGILGFYDSLCKIGGEVLLKAMKIDIVFAGTRNNKVLSERVTKVRLSKRLEFSRMKSKLVRNIMAMITKGARFSITINVSNEEP